MLRNVCDGDVISGNTIRRTGGAGPLISLAPQSGGICAGATIAGNTLTQGTPRWTVYAEAFGHGAITGNAITYTVPAPAFSAIYDRSTVAEFPITALAISGNSVAGAVTYGVTLESYPGSLGEGIAVTGNVATGTTVGLRCRGPALFTAPIVASGNSLGPSAYGTVLVSGGE